jgi:hypothetical protein
MSFRGCRAVEKRAIQIPQYCRINDREGQVWSNIDKVMY